MQATYLLHVELVYLQFFVITPSISLKIYTYYKIFIDKIIFADYSIDSYKKTASFRRGCLIKTL